MDFNDDSRKGTCVGYFMDENAYTMLCIEGSNGRHTYELLGVSEEKAAMLRYAAMLEGVVASLRLRANEYPDNVRPKFKLINGKRRKP